MKKAFMVFIAFLLFGCAATTPKMETYMGKAVFDVNISTPGNEVVNNVYDSMAIRSDQLTKTVGFMPSRLPSQPGAPNIGLKSMGFGIASFALPRTTCDNAYAIMTGYDKGVSSSAYGTSDMASYTSCIYPYKSAYRVYIIGSFMSSSSGGLGALMADAIKKGVSKTSGYNNIYDAWFDSIVKKFKEKDPQAKAVDISMP